MVLSKLKSWQTLNLWLETLSELYVWDIKKSIMSNLMLNQTTWESMKLKKVDSHSYVLLVLEMY